MNAFREALADKYQQYQIPSKEEVLDTIRNLKREYPTVEDSVIKMLEKNMGRYYDRLRREMIGYSVFNGIMVAGAPIILLEINKFKKDIAQDQKELRRVVNAVSKLKPEEQYNSALDELWNEKSVDNTGRSHFKREEEVAEPLITPVPKEMGTTNPLVRPDATETINPLARK
jgi:hypothetical protein